MTGANRPLILRNGRFLDPETGLVTEGTLTAQDGVVAQVGSGSPGGAGEVLDLHCNTVIPGLIDAHFHAYAADMGGLLLERRILSYLALVAAQRLHDALERGFTTVRDVAGGDAGLSLAIRERKILSPRYLFTGPALSQTGGHGDPRAADVDLCFSHGHLSQIVDGVDNLRRAARERFRTGAHAIKLMTSGGVGSPTDPIGPPQYSAEEIRAVCDEADRRGSYVAAHAYSAEAIIHSVRNGVRSIEHGNLLDDASAAAMRDAGAFLVPTLGAYDAISRRADEAHLPQFVRIKNAEVLEAGLTSLAVAERYGIPIGFGSDNMGDFVDEQLVGIKLQLRTRSPLDVLRSATAVNADLLQRPDLGRIRIGAAADLLVLDGDPLLHPEVIWNQQRPRTVIQAGQVVS